jgi:hypothetical protein
MWWTDKLHRPALITLLLVEIGIVAALSVLYYLSQRDYGFVPVKQVVPINFGAGAQSLQSNWNIGFFVDFLAIIVHGALQSLLNYRDRWPR